MNWIYKYCFLFSIALQLTSCNIDEKIIDKPTDANIKTENDVTALVSGMYGNLQEGSCFRTNGMHLLFLCADDFYSDSGSFFRISNHDFDGSLSSVQGFWNSLYLTIRNSNNVINVLDNLELSEKFEKRAYGDAYFVRALCYFYLVRLYGGVPLVTQPVNVNSNFYQRRNTVDEVYSQIFKDFKKASTSLPIAKDLLASELGKATKGASHALLAKSYLTYGNYQSLNNLPSDSSFIYSSNYADSVINSNQYALLDNFADLFDVKKEVNAYKEVIFGIRYTRDFFRSQLKSTGSEFAPNLSPQNFSNVAGTTTTNGNGNMKVHPYIVDFYRTGDYAGDYRADATYTTRGFNKNNGKFHITFPGVKVANTETVSAWGHIKKYVDGEGFDSRNHENDFFICRLADVHLIKAEAMNELYGPTADAYASFNKVRERARKADGTVRTTPANIVTGLTKEEFRLKVFHEREAELIGEGDRFFDLVRTKSPVDPNKTMFEYRFFTLYPTLSKKAPVYNNTTKTWSETKSILGNYDKVSVKHKLLPIPISELINNPNFGDNNPLW
ncbi:MAG: RagB/SusD family nutrient uptake outer membrane protein [Pseudarcicella sp.]|nr:RagB/SusD family nutrient uptake outer membrane protein [Pseudarcicella sp.]MBP6409673.1 RagB/SusD family nutrient uptake outer membrane protein [Pseudarcicella sp.]